MTDMTAEQGTEIERLLVELEDWKESFCQAADAAERLAMGELDDLLTRWEVEYEYEVWQDGALQAGGREADYASAKSEANHYAMLYATDGPVEVRIYEKRLVAASRRSQRK